MAQLLSPVCTDSLKLHNPVQCFYSRSKVPIFCNNFSSLGYSGRKRGGLGRIKVAYQESAAASEEIADDFYAVLGLLPDATPAQIKKAYYSCMKACHPDLSGDDPETTNFCMFINEVYEILSDPVQRRVYDEIHGYTATAINPFLSDSSPKDHVFVDEFSCIGCKNCANVCSKVFGIEEDFGRARVYDQCGHPDLIQQAIDSCPVDCIHWTSAAQLSLLEDEMRRIERVNAGQGLEERQTTPLQSYLSWWSNKTEYDLPSTAKIAHSSLSLVALMLSGMGSGAMDVFRMASTRWEKRQSKVLEQAKVRMMKKKDSEKTESYWDNLWGDRKDYTKTEEEVEDRSKRAAAAARRWREYSRRGADKPPTFKLPEAISNDN